MEKKRSWWRRFRALFFPTSPDRLLFAFLERRPREVDVPSLQERIREAVRAVERHEQLQAFKRPQDRVPLIPPSPRIEDVGSQVGENDDCVIYKVSSPLPPVPNGSNSEDPFR